MQKDITKDFSVSENSILDVAETHEEVLLQQEDTEDITGYYDTLRINLNVYGADYRQALQDLSDKLDAIYNKDIVASVSENAINVTVSQNDTETEIVENPLITTDLKDYSLTDSLLLLVVLFLVITDLLIVLFIKNNK